MFPYINKSKAYDKIMIFCFKYFLSQKQQWGTDVLPSIFITDKELHELGVQLNHLKSMHLRTVIACNLS